ncbi:hypothetical protein VC188_11335 [Polynucleobacter sp. MG-28-Ekke-A2]|uniref:hypothetical protein n=1 Tax=Polynucleobacter sp. MG-28-Ekke-A2 TaxID=3108276 RepID=UPI002B2319F9|nr:hypothetical protein [Polynucleobacter sp. MG-28-Ekke-A2]MEA9602709.1 hypothetical protein [Polynucleobacter sp. MG-28-Ekke-A2]
MKKIIFILLICAAYKLSFAQLNISNNAPQSQAVTNPAMVIQVGQRKLEVMANLRALPLGNSKYQLISSDSAYSSGVYGVAYDHTQKAYVFLTGDISFKLLNNSGLSAIPSNISLRSKLLTSPSTYVFNVSSPADVVNLFNQLKSSPAVEWAEVFTVQGVVGP